MSFWSPFSRTGSFRPENLGHHALAMIGNLCFSLFVIGVLIFTIIAATFQPEDPLFHPTTKITSFLTSVSNATFNSDTTLVKTGEDFITLNQTVFQSFLNLTDVEVKEEDRGGNDCGGKVDQPIDCRDPEVFHVMMKAAIEFFKDIHFYRFGKPVRGSNHSSCDMAWRYRPKEGKAAGFYKDYRRFVISRSENCTVSVTGMGEYHSGVNARKRQKKLPGFENQKEPVLSIPVFGDTANDALPVVVSEDSFGRGKYLVYMDGGDRCKSMNHYLWSFLCALGEARFLNRTLVMDLSICLSKIYSLSNRDEEGKDFRFYFDFEHLSESGSVLDKDQFWSDWETWQRKGNLKLRLVEDFRVTPMKLRGVKDTLIMRKFGSVEPDNYWYRVCEGEAESAVERPWQLLWKSKRLMDIVSGIATKMDFDYDAVRIERGDNAETLLSTLKDKIKEDRRVYIAPNEEDTAFFDPLKDKYATRFLDDFKDLWDESSEWYSETTKLNRGNPVEFDGYMRASVDTEVFLRGKKQIETVNGLTKE